MTDLDQKIEYLIKRWEEDNQYKSNIDTDHIAYKAIVSLGNEAVPYLLKYLGKSWIIPYALYEITGESIDLDDDDKGIFDVINAAWLKWGEQKGLIKDSNIVI